jgi:hypothetical protein
LRGLRGFAFSILADMVAMASDETQTASPDAHDTPDLDRPAVAERPNANPTITAAKIQSFNPRHPRNPRMAIGEIPIA